MSRLLYTLPASSLWWCIKIQSTVVTARERLSTFILLLCAINRCSCMEHDLYTQWSICSFGKCLSGAHKWSPECFIFPVTKLPALYWAACDTLSSVECSQANDANTQEMDAWQECLRYNIKPRVTDEIHQTMSETILSFLLLGVWGGSSSGVNVTWQAGLLVLPPWAEAGEYRSVQGGGRVKISSECQEILHQLRRSFASLAVSITSTHLVLNLSVKKQLQH